MGKHSKKLRQNRILQLDNDEVANPEVIVKDFFHASWLPSHLRKLKKWRNYVAFGSDNPKGINSASLLYDHELTIKLVEAAWLLKDRKLGKVYINEGKESEITKLYIQREMKKFGHYSKNLKIKEIIAPSSVFKRYLSTNLDDYRRILGIWLYDALSNIFMEESSQKCEVITVYENLVKLFEAAWLINKRTNPTF
jgi:hypothetical protein